MNYKVSKDYPRLKQLLDEGHKIVCWVTWDWSHGNNDMVTDIAEAKRLICDSYEETAIDGIEYVLDYLI